MMKELSFFLLKNSFGARMRKGFKNSCNGDNSTSTLSQCKPDTILDSAHDPSPYATPTKTPPTLEEMILQLEFEEMMARKAKLDDEYVDMRRRMSCVNNSDILRSARNALNQYPRFSLDGKDAMYRSSFRNHGLKSSSRDCLNNNMCLPKKLGGERVVWCKPGVVAKLMGLEAIPVPAHSNKEKPSCVSNKKKNSRKRAQNHEMARRKIVNDELIMNPRATTRYSLMQPIFSQNGAGWPLKNLQ